jgi:hypothetical protein
VRDLEWMYETASFYPDPNAAQLDRVDNPPRGRAGYLSSRPLGQAFGCPKAWIPAR